MSSFNLRIALLRRWYIVLVGLVLAVGAVYGTTSLVPAHHEVTADVVLLPPKSDLNAGDNPYLQLNGLDTMGGLLARAVTSPEMQDTLLGAGATATYDVVPDQTISGPVLAISVDDVSLDGANRVLDSLLGTIPDQLRTMQSRVGTPTRSYITSTLVSEDRVGTLVRTTQTRAMVLVIGLVGGLTLLAVGLVEIVVTRRRSRTATVAEPDRAGQFGVAEPEPEPGSSGGAGVSLPGGLPGARPAPVAAAIPDPSVPAASDPVNGGSLHDGWATRPGWAVAGSLGKSLNGSNGHSVPAAAANGQPGVAAASGQPPAVNGAEATSGRPAAPLTPSRGWLLSTLTRERLAGGPKPGPTTADPSVHPLSPGRMVGAPAPDVPSGAAAGAASSAVPFGASAPEQSAGAQGAPSTSGPSVPPSTDDPVGMSTGEDGKDAPPGGTGVAKDEKGPHASGRSDPPTGSFERLVMGPPAASRDEPDPRAAAHRLT